MEQKKRSNSKRSETKIIPPKGNVAQGMSRDEVRSLNKKRIRRKRRIKRFALLAALAVAIISVGIVLVLSVFFEIGTVTVKGDKVYAATEVISKSGVEIGDNLFRVSEEDLNEKLTKSLPYIEKVTLERELPDTVIITVKATREVAALQSGTGFVLVDHTGKVLDKNASILREGVAVIGGVTPKKTEEGENLELDNETVTEDIVTILTAVKKNGFNLLTEIQRTKSGEYELRYDDRITLKIGTVDNIDVKLKRAAAAIEKENEINAYSEGVLDLKTEPYAYFSPGAEEETTKPQTTAGSSEPTSETATQGEQNTSETAENND